MLRTASSHRQELPQGHSDVMGGDNASLSSSARSVSSLRLTGAARRMQALLDTNALLASLGFGARAFEDYDDLVASVSSMGVALYEKLFQFHLDDVVRVPRAAEDYVHNAQLVVDALRGALLDDQFDAQQLTGDALCDGDVASIQQFIGMFQHIHDVLYSSEESGVARDQGDNMTDDPTDRSRDERTREVPPALRAQRETKKTTRDARKPAATTTAARSRTAAVTSRDRRVVSAAGGRSASGAAKPRTATATPVQAAKIKKRTRRVEATTQLKTAGQRRKDEELEQELLTTQQYGRYVRVPQLSRRHANDLQGDEDPASEMDSALEFDRNDFEVGETYFGGVSSVSGASGSAASIHYMEEEGEFAQNFSAIQSHSSPGTNSKDSPEMDSTPDRNGHVEESTTPRKSKNQEDADDDDIGGARHQAADDAEGTTSPVKKKLATAKTTMSPTKQSRTRQPTTRLSPPQPVKSSLYPLQPETKRNDKTSKAHKEYLRYKIQLKDHLHELRQREYCQRQHLERAYRLGEHAANVERIRARRFEQELRMHRISIGLDAKTQEEKQLRDAMQHMLKLEKEKLRDEHRTTAKTLQQIQRDHAEREQALETFYATQIQLVKEQTRRELEERETVEKAHRLASEQMIREMRRERERELASLLKEKQHLAEVRRFRHATHLTQAIERGTEISARQGDAFYAAAMKARQLRAVGATPTSNTAKRSTTTRHVSKATKAVYSNRGGGRTAVRV